MNKRIYLYIILLLAFIALFIQSVFNITLIMKSASKIDETETYKNSKNIDYSVNIKQNDFLKETVLPSKGTYINSLINSIDFDYNYEISLKKALNLESEHQIKAFLVVEYNETGQTHLNPIIWEKEYPLTELKKDASLSSKTHKISEKFKIDFRKFNDEAFKFTTAFEMPIISYIRIEISNNLNAESNSYKLAESDKNILKIPLLEKITYIEGAISKTDQKALIDKTETVNISTTRGAIYAGILVTSVVAIFLIFRQLPIFYEEANYERIMKEIKEEYDEIIVETSSMIDVKEYKPIVITAFKELVNLSQSLETPIILFEKEHLSCFYILNAKILYIFLVKDNNKELIKLFE